MDFVNCIRLKSKCEKISSNDANFRTLLQHPFTTNPEVNNFGLEIPVMPSVP